MASQRASFTLTAICSMRTRLTSNESVEYSWSSTSCLQHWSKCGVCSSLDRLPTRPHNLTSVVW